jgi:hypothetical protein
MARNATAAWLRRSVNALTDMPLARPGDILVINKA